MSRVSLDCSPANGGLVRAARRPLGWAPGGPLPAGPQGRPELAPSPGEDLCYLTGEWRIFQRLVGHRWSLDDLMTAWFAVEHAPQRLHRTLDLGCGIGSVLMMVAWAFPEAQAKGIEAQELSQSLARRSVAYNGAQDRITIVHGDIREPSTLPEGAQYDLVTGTPPYIPHGRGVVSDKPQCEPCRFEVRGGIEAYCEAAARALAPGGRFVVCEGANPHQRTFEAAQEAGLAVVSFQDVIPREGKPALFTLYAMAQAGEGNGIPAKREPFVVRDARGERTPACRAVRQRMGIPP